MKSRRLQSVTNEWGLNPQVTRQVWRSYPYLVSWWILNIHIAVQHCKISASMVLHASSLRKRLQLRSQGSRFKPTINGLEWVTELAFTYSISTLNHCLFCQVLKHPSLKIVYNWTRRLIKDILMKKSTHTH